MTVGLHRSQIRKILRRHRGAPAEIARSLGVRPENVYKWLKGQTVSARIAQAVQVKALELQARELEASAWTEAEVR